MTTRQRKIKKAVLQWDKLTDYQLVLLGGYGDTADTSHKAREVMLVRLRERRELLKREGVKNA